MITLLVSIVILGFIAWLLTAVVPLPPPFGQIVIGVAALIALLMVLHAFGLWSGHLSLS